jgi:hypothetical protein
MRIRKGPLTAFLLNIALWGLIAATMLWLAYGGEFVSK